MCDEEKSNVRHNQKVCHHVNEGGFNAIVVPASIRRKQENILEL